MKHRCSLDIKNTKGLSGIIYKIENKISSKRKFKLEFDIC